jgi:hypothetical protein
MAFLATETLDFGDRDPLHADETEGFTHLVQLEGFDDGSDHLHGAAPVAAVASKVDSGG